MNRRLFLQHIPIFVLPLAIPLVGCKTTGTGEPTQEQIAGRIRAIAHLTSYLAASGVVILADREGPDQKADALKKLNQARVVADSLLLSDNLSLGVIVNALKAAGIGSTSSAQGDLIVNVVEGIVLIVDVYGWVEFNPNTEFHVRAALVGIRDGLYTVVGPLPEVHTGRTYQEAKMDLENEVSKTAEPFVKFWNTRRKVR